MVFHLGQLPWAAKGDAEGMNTVDSVERAANIVKSMRQRFGTECTCAHCIEIRGLINDIERLAGELQDWRYKAEQREMENRELRTNTSSNEQMRKALIGLIGAESVDELQRMEVMLRSSVVPEADKKVTINAIHALIGAQAALGEGESKPVSISREEFVNALADEIAEVKHDYAATCMYLAKRVTEGLYKKFDIRRRP